MQSTVSTPLVSRQRSLPRACTKGTSKNWKTGPPKERQEQPSTPALTQEARPHQAMSKWLRRPNTTQQITKATATKWPLCLPAAQVDRVHPRPRARIQRNSNGEQGYPKRVPQARRKLQKCPAAEAGYYCYPKKQGQHW